MAALAGIDEQYLYQCLTGRKAMLAREAVRVERVLGGRVRRWHLRQKDWHENWPELIGTEGAPPVPTQEVRDAA
jgi:DNA-binding transcriptional regulator YdaS (Cro superfamily)